MIIHSDWHMHSEASHDSALPASEIAKNAREFGFSRIGLTDHLNLNDQKFLSYLDFSSVVVEDLKSRFGDVTFGVELTPIEKPRFDYVAKHGNDEGFVAHSSGSPFAIELALTKDELRARGVRYAIGAAHWRVDVPNGRYIDVDFDATVKEWYRQQLYLACDERVTILGHPWYHGRGPWYKDFSLIPQSMKDDIAAALKENGKYVECNSHFFINENTTEKFRHQYAEFLRWMFEMGIPVTYGSDSHNEYKPRHVIVEKYLLDAGFADGDIVGLDDSVLW